MKRSSELARVIELRPGQPLQRRQGLRAVGFTVRVYAGGAERVTPLKPRPKATGFPAAVKLAVRTRAGQGDPDAASCEACGLWLGREKGQIQHRVARGMGGTSLPVNNSPANGTLLCGTPFELCHGLCEKRDEGMNEEGFWLRAGEDPLETPILLHSQYGSEVTVWLGMDGEYHLQPPVGGAA